MKNSLIFTLIAVIGIVGFGVYLLSGSMNNEDSKPQNTNQVAMTENAGKETEDMNNNTIIDIAAGNPDFSILVTAVTEAGLVETLSGRGPFTVFAPTNEAFAKLPEGTIESLLQDKEALTKVLTYHVVAGKVMSSDVVKLQSATTVQGQEVAVNTTGGKVLINDSEVVQADIEASNGVIHVIDTVLLPK
jgi:uncharacterized surface protein with fasciclin (FAS1) repeats